MAVMCIGKVDRVTLDGARLVATMSTGYRFEAMFATAAAAERMVEEMVDLSDAGGLPVEVVRENPSGE